MIKEFQAFLTAFKKGKELTNAKIWKDVQGLSNALLGFLGALLMIANGFMDYQIHIDNQTLTAAAGGIAAFAGIYNAIATVVTSSKVGIKNKK